MTDRCRDTSSVISGDSGTPRGKALLGPLAGARRITGIDGAVLGIVALQAALHIVAANLALGWSTAVGTVAIVAFAEAALAMSPLARALVVRLGILGIVAGICELFTDAAGEWLGSLHYPANEPMLWASPAYMPFSWAVVLLPLGYGAWRLAGLLPRGAAALLMGGIGAAIIPFYEEMAYHAGWWRYTPVHTIWHTPLYVLLFEGLIAAALPWLVVGVETRSWRNVATRGIVLGAWMPWAALIAWLILGR
jgi:hypothetical protein